MDRNTMRNILDRYAEQVRANGGQLSSDDTELFIAVHCNEDISASQQKRVMEMKQSLTPRTPKQTVATHVANHRAAKKTIAESPVSEEEGISILNKLFNGETLTPEETAKVNAMESQILGQSEYSEPGDTGTEITSDADETVENLSTR